MCVSVVDLMVTTLRVGTQRCVFDRGQAVVAGQKKSHGTKKKRERGQQ